MRVATDPEIFSDDDLFEVLVRFIALIIEARHHWDVDPVSEKRASDYFERNAPARAAVYRQLMQKSVTDAAYRPPPAAGRPRITLSTARASIRDLERPALVVLENQESDGTFLNAVFRAFGRDDLLAALDAGRLSFRHAGGGKVIFRKIAIEAAREYGVHVRVCGVMDSDRLVPHARTDAHSHAAQLADHGVAVLVLALREVENYIPPAALAPLVEKSGVGGAVTALARLSPEQRGYYDMKNGFGATGSKPAAVRPEQRDLFADLDPRLVQELGHGFDGKIIKCLMRRDLDLTAADFGAVGPGVRAELDELIAMIDEVL
ncbi:hypothetical protein FF36_00979 [Frankia torreyi]|uniref:Uncharacterized protein n=1 Tax=Frankia torreyi TaxID=1856 RepID=A0A0D8BKH8_9ACTN|nr:MULTISPECIES: hypothetical protein [Frankia]KJE24605.1 hypothetical protein FF36_00979 [Frankia torreyi]KQM07690.1 hypothetical protein FF86_1002178 [Frankia sp. CpI1-P]